MILNAEHPYTKFFTLHLDGDIQQPYFQYDTILKIVALGKDETAKLLAWEIARAYKAKLVISESYEINPGMFVRDVQADFTLQFSAKCPSNVRAQILG
jgi:hypothetical protein